MVLEYIVLVWYTFPTGSLGGKTCAPHCRVQDAGVSNKCCVSMCIEKLVGKKKLQHNMGSVCVCARVPVASGVLAEMLSTPFSMAWYSQKR